MKKVLLTSTALVAFAGAASAEVTISGSAEMGIFGGTDMETQFFQDIDVTFSMSGETDGGLTFGASVDLDEAQDSCSGATATTVIGTGTTATTVTVVTDVDCTNDALDDVTEDGGVAIFISGSFGTVTMGDTDGALDWAVTEAGNIGNPGSIADDETGHSGYNGSYLDGSYDGQIVRYDNTFGDFGVAISVEMDESGDADTGYAIGFKYNTALSGADLALGIGYQSVDEDMAKTILGQDIEDALGASAVVTLDSGFSGGLVLTQFGAVDGDEDVQHIGVGMGYSMDAFSVHFNYGQYTADGEEDLTGWGLAAAYDLGGGASVKAGYGSSDDGDDTTDTFSVGLAMSF